MSTSVLPQSPTPASGTSPSSAAPSGAPAPTAPPEWRVSDTDSRVWARGKTAAEVLDIAGQLEGALRNYATAPAAAPAPPAVANGQNFTEGEYVRGDELNRLAPKIVQDAVAPQMASLHEQMAGMALDTVRSQFPSDFQKYGHEIYGMLSTLNKQSGAWTVDNLRRVVRMVRADHVDEIVRDTLNAQSTHEPALRSMGAAPVSVVPAATDFSVKSEQLSSDYREKLANAGITDRAMEEFCAANQMSVPDFFKMIVRQNPITEAPRR